MSARRGRSGILLLVILGCAIFQASVSGQATGRADLSVVAIEITGPTPEWNDGLPTNTTLRVTITNIGNGRSQEGYRIDYEWLQDRQATWLNGAETHSIDYHVPASSGSEGPTKESILDPGESRTHAQNWRLQPGQEGAGAIRVTIHPYGLDEQDANNRRSKETFVAAHDLDLVPIGNEDAIPLRPDQTDFIRVRLENRGNVPESTHIRLTGTDEGDASRLDAAWNPQGLEDAGLLVPPETAETATLLVHFPFSSTGDDRPFSVHYGIQATRDYAASVLHAESPEFYLLDEPMIPGSPAHFERRDAGVLAADPGGFATARFRLTNVGDTRDTYSVAGKVSEAGWGVAVDSARLALGPGETASFEAVVAFPAGAPHGATASAEVSVISDRDAVLGETPLVQHVGLRIHGPTVLVVAGGEWPEDAYVADNWSLPIRVLNQGDRVTPNGTLSVAVSGPGSFEGSATAPVPRVQAGSAVEVVVPFGAFPEPGGLIDVTAAWSPNATDEHPISARGLAHSIFVRHANVSLAAPAAAAGVPGETVAYRTAGNTFLATNAGNTDLTLRLRATTDQGTVALVLDGDTISLSPGETRSIPFDHTLPLPAGNHENARIDVVASVESRPELRWSANTTTHIVDSEPPRILIRSTWPDNWTIGAPLRLSIGAEDASGVAGATVHLEKLDSGTESASPMKRASAGTWSTTIDLDDEGPQRVTVSVMDVRGNAANLTLPEVHGVPPAPPTVRLSGPEAGSEVGPQDAFVVNVMDERSVEASVKILWTENRTQIRTEPLTLGPQGTAEIRIGDAPAGNLTVQVRAVNEIGSTASDEVEVVFRGNETSGTHPDTSIPQAIVDSPASGLAALIFAFFAPAVLFRRRRSGMRPRTRNGEKGIHQARAPSRFMRPQARRRIRARRERSLAGPRRCASALVMVVLMAAAVVFGAVGPADHSAADPHVGVAAEDQVSAPDLQRDVRRLWDALPGGLDVDIALGPAARMLFDSPEGASALRHQPTDASSLMADLAGPDLARYPVPTAPPGPEPLLAAIQSLDDMAHLPDTPLLRAKIAELDLTPAAEDGLARLVLAYAQALRLEDMAVEDLSIDERRLLENEPAAWAAWHRLTGDHGADARAEHMEGLRARVNLTAHLQAADLLVRTVEDVKDVLVLPPASSEESMGTDEAPGALVAASDSPSSDLDAWRGVRKIVAATDPLSGGAPLPPLPDESLLDALTNLALVLGIPAEKVDGVELPELPPSLEDALAGIVTARWVGLSSHDAATHSRLLIQEAQQAEPVLGAWSAILTMERPSPRLSDNQIRPFVAAALTPSSSPLDLVSAGDEQDRPTAVTGESLSDLLVGHGVPTRDAIAAAKNVPPDVATAVALAWSGSLRLYEANAESGEAVRHDAREDREIFRLLHKDGWSQADATRVLAWAQRDRRDSDAGAAGLREAQVAALAGVEAAAGLLGPRASGGGSAASSGPLQGGGSMSTSSPVPLPCPEGAPLSDCSNDILLYVPGSAESPGVVVTGSGRSVLTNQLFSPAPAPQIIIDLGGDDVYEIPAGVGVPSAPVGLLIDVDGDDRYVSDRPLDHGAADGAGMLGVLWDLAGDDRYEHEGVSTAVDNRAQGAGGAGGIGVLVDGAGEDVYYAPNAIAHGVAGSDGADLVTPEEPLEFLQDYPLPTADAAGAGILLDLGPGDDQFRANRGQGFAGEDYARALLYNEDGAAHYETRITNAWYQGGVRPDSSYSVGILLDLGGAGTVYSSETLPRDLETTGFHAVPGTAASTDEARRTRHDDSFWVLIGAYMDAAGMWRSLGIGIDSTFDDGDGDGIPDTADVLGEVSLQDVLDLVEDPPGVEDLLDPESLGLFPVPGEAFDEALGLYRPGVQADPCDVDIGDREPYSLLYVSGPWDEMIDVVAHVQVDLGGNDTYVNEVAGPSRFCVTGSATPGMNEGQLLATGGLAVDFGGNDVYENEGRTYTQGAILPEWVSLATNHGNRASMLLDVAGNDTYRAGEFSQGASSGDFIPEQGSALGIVLDAALSPLPSAAAWLVDLAGDDRYEAGSESQGFASLGHGVGGLVDWQGDDEYRFATQGRVAEGDYRAVSSALFYDGGGNDRYISHDLLIELESIANPDDARYFRDQGVLDAEPALLIDASVSTRAVFVDDGVENDTYERLINENPVAYADISHIKNNNQRLDVRTAIGITTRPVTANGFFTDGLTRPYAATDEDGDGAANVIETLGGSDPGDADDTPGTFWDDPSDVRAIDGDDLWFDMRGVAGTGVGAFAIGGRADNEYWAGPYDFLVDLGGADDYRSLGVGSGTLTLDVGEGDDRYAPEADPDVPSLGATSSGAALLFDDGGDNLFLSDGSLTQAAAVTGGIGVLITWNADNRFEANAGTAAQGAAAGAGYAVLASFGPGSDVYVSEGAGIAQGAASAAGEAVLADGGGDNVYWVVNASRAQGSATGPGSVGILWSGEGTDLYSGPSFVQGAAQASGTGVLIDAGGHDVYSADTRAQGSASGGTGWLVDLGGYDAYRASDLAQGHVLNLQGVGVLFDMVGRDYYSVADNGHGWSELGCGTAVLIDAGGVDTYESGSAKVPFDGMDPGSDGNDGAWTRDGCNSPTGVDSSDVGEALGSLTRVPDTVQLLVLSGGTRLTEQETTEGKNKLTLRATVEADDPGEVRRASFFVDEDLVGHGEYNAGDSDEGRLAFDYLLEISPHVMPDGLYEVRAVVLAEPADGSNKPPVGSPTMPARESDGFELQVDNSPAPEVALDGDLISSYSTAAVNVTLARDFQIPEGAVVSPACDNESMAPGGYVNIEATGNGADRPVFDGYCHAGTLSVDLQEIATDADGPWDDGMYDLAVRVTDHADQTSVVPVLAALRVDTTPPDSEVALEFVGARSRNGTDVMLPINATDVGGSGVETAFVFLLSGTQIEHAHLVEGTDEMARFPAAHGDELQILVVAHDRGGNSESPCLSAGEEPVVVDGLPTCYQGKLASEGPDLVTVDYEPPQLIQVRSSHRFLQPGAAATYSAEAIDVDTGVRAVSLQFLDADGKISDEATMSPGGDSYEVTYEHNATGEGVETPFFYQVLATDHANNSAASLESGFLDDRPPRVSHTATEYFELIGSSFEDSKAAGAPGRFARVKLHIQDVPGVSTVDSLAEVSVDVSELNGTEMGTWHEPCHGNVHQEGSWLCTFRLADDVDDGVYRVPITATDAAGNVNITQTADVVISTEHFPISDLEVVEVRHDGFVLHWTTELMSGSRVGYGRAPHAEGEEFAQVFEGPPGVRTNHTVDVSGLSPSSRYFFQAVSESDDGVLSISPCTTAECPSVVTEHSFAFGWRNLSPGQSFRGITTVDYELDFSTGTTPVQMQFFVQDAAQVSSPVSVAEPFERGQGTGAVDLVTTDFADGTYVLTVKMNRLSERLVDTSIPFRIDNSEPVVVVGAPLPGSRTSNPAPLVEVVIMDPGGEPPMADHVQFKVDGVRVPIDIEESEPLGADGLRLRFAPRDDVGHGDHVFNVSVTDSSGNAGFVTWDVLVDRKAPELAVVNATALPGPINARPGGQVQVLAVVQDDASVAEVHVDLTSVGGSMVDLLHGGGDDWKAIIDVPAGAAGGVHRLQLTSADGLANEGEIGTVSITVDANPPSVEQVVVRDVGFDVADVAVMTDEPTRARVVEGAWSPWGTSHRLQASGLAPGKEQDVEIEVVDEAGWLVDVVTNVTTMADTEPPGTPKELAASSPDEGVVVLSWQAADDNAGVQHYVVRRGAADRSPEAEFVAEALEFRDDGAPAGRSVTYYVAAVDIAGIPGSESFATIDVTARPVLSNLSVSPELGPATEPFLVSVTYQHASGRPAQSITVRLAGETHPMHVAAESPPCYDGCRYEASVYLPPTSHVRGDRVVQVTADDGDYFVTLRESLAPRVTGEQVDDITGGGQAQTPGLSVLLALGGILASAWGLTCHRRRRS